MVGKWGILEPHACLHSGVFSDGNFTYTVEPRVLVESQEVPQVGPPTALSPQLCLQPLVTSASLPSSVTPAPVSPLSPK